MTTLMIVFFFMLRASADTFVVGESKKISRSTDDKDWKIRGISKRERGAGEGAPGDVVQMQRDGGAREAKDEAPVVVGDQAHNGKNSTQAAAGRRRRRRGWRWRGSSRGSSNRLFRGWRGCEETRDLLAVVIVVLF